MKIGTARHSRGVAGISHPDQLPDRGASDWPDRVMLVCSSGGHLTQLVKLRPWWGSRARRWVTFPGRHVDSVLTGEDVVYGHHPTTRSLPNAIRNFFLAWRVLQDFRPDIVLSDGAGIAFPFFCASRLLGIRTVYLEVFDRIDSATLTGRLCYPLADLFLLQWEEQQRCYRRGVVIGSVFE